MKTNVGGIDRILRIVIGLVLIGLAATGTVGWWGWLGIVPLATVRHFWLEHLLDEKQNLSLEISCY